MEVIVDVRNPGRRGDYIVDFDLENKVYALDTAPEFRD
jgi:hypothetical protein